MEESRKGIGRKRLLLAKTAGMAIIVATLLFSGCKTVSITYSFSGVNLDPAIKTAQVDYFPNRAPVVQAQLSQLFTDALIDKIQSSTSLELVPAGGDIVFSGEIRRYDTRPTAITGSEVAAQNRLTIGIRVIYTDNMNPDNNFESEFSRFEDYDSGSNLADVENELIDLILENILEDIINRAFVNW